MGKSEKVKIEYESTLELDQAVSYLEKLLEGLKSGTLRVEKEAEAVTLHPRGPVTLEVEAKQKRERESFEISMKWHRVPESADEEVLTISDDEVSQTGAASREERAMPYPTEAGPGEEDESEDREPLVTEPPPVAEEPAELPESDQPPPAPEPDEPPPVPEPPPIPEPFEPDDER